VSYWRFWQGPTREHGPFGGNNVPPAIHRLRRPGERSGLIEDDSGYHFAWYLSEQAPKHVPLRGGQGGTTREVLPHLASGEVQSTAGQLGANHKIEVYPDRLFPQPGS
jgi:hypothetical protein